MEIDRAYLDAVIADASKQERDALEHAARARGAIILAEALIARLGEAPKQDAPAADKAPGAPALSVVP